MGWPVCNATLENEKIDEVPLWQNGLTFHGLSLIVGGAFALTAAGVSFFLIMCHATHYSKPIEQRHIIRILVMVPVYSLVSWLGIFFYRHAIYYDLIGSCYEAFAISAFFALLCHYIAPDLHSQKDYFRGITPKRWIWPVPWFQRCSGGERGIWRTPRSGLTWFNVIWAGVFQYCFLRVLMTVLAVITQSVNDYCEETLNPAFAHVWVLTIEAAAVSVAMYCLIQFYYQIRHDIRQYSPFLKILSIKLVIFLSFWQTTLISLLFSTGVIKPSNKVQTPDLKVGVPNLLITIEMAIFAFLHLWAFTWKPYSLHQAGAAGEVTDFYGNGKITYQGGRLGLRALADAANPWDLFKAIGRTFRWIFVGRKKRMLDPSYQSQNDTIGLKPATTSTMLPSTSMSGPSMTAYEGAITGGHAIMSDGRTDRYGSSPDEEGEVLLAHAQPNPSISDLPPSTAYYGMAVSSYDDLPRGAYIPANPGHNNDDNLLDPPGARSTPRPYSPYHDAHHTTTTTSSSPYNAPADYRAPATSSVPARNGPPDMYSHDMAYEPTQMPVAATYFPPPPPPPPPPMHQGSDYERR